MRDMYPFNEVGTEPRSIITFHYTITISTHQVDSVYLCNKSLAVFVTGCGIERCFHAIKPLRRTCIM